MNLKPASLSFALDELTLNELKELKIAIDDKIKNMREERERILQEYQKELDKLLMAMDEDGFYIVTPDYTANYTEYVVKDREVEE